MKKRVFSLAMIILLAIIATIATAMLAGCNGIIDLTMRPPEHGDTPPPFGRFVKFFEDEYRIDQDDFISLSDGGNYNWFWERGGLNASQRLGGRIMMLKHAPGYALAQTMTSILTGNEVVFIESMFSDLATNPHFMVDGKLFIHEAALLTMRFENATFGGVPILRYFRPNTQLREGHSLHNPVADARAGYDFLGWQRRGIDGQLIPFVFGGRINESIVLYANWIRRVDPTNYVLPIIPAQVFAHNRQLSSIELPHSWRWANGEQLVGNATNLRTTDVIYSRGIGFSEIIRQISFVVNRAVNYTLPENVHKDFGQPLSQARLPAGWEWIGNQSEPVGNVGLHERTARFTPEDTINFEIIERVIVVEVLRVEPVVLTPTARSAVFNNTLSQVLLPDGWAWVASGNTLVGNVGVQNHTARFTPIDLVNYKTVYRVIRINVERANPVVSTPSARNSTFGDTLSMVALPDRWSWAAAGTMAVGNASASDTDLRMHRARYTPADSANFNTVYRYIGINVARRTPNPTNPVGLEGLRGRPLSSVGLPTGWTWNIPNTIMNTAGESPFQATYRGIGGETNINPVPRTLSVFVDAEARFDSFAAFLSAQASELYGMLYLRIRFSAAEHLSASARALYVPSAFIRLNLYGLGYNVNLQNFRIVAEQRSSPLEIFLTDVSILAPTGHSAIMINSSSITTINFAGQNRIQGANGGNGINGQTDANARGRAGSHAIWSQEGELRINATGGVWIQGGNGGNAVRHTVNGLGWGPSGGAGASGIYSLGTVSISSSAYMTVSGGHGGNGARGNGGGHLRYRHGGHGGMGAIGIRANSINSINGNRIVLLGGNGGNGYAGVSTAYLGNNGGHGGMGGQGGHAVYVVQGVQNISVSEARGGNGGNAGNGGAGRTVGNGGNGGGGGDAGRAIVARSILSYAGVLQSGLGGVGGARGSGGSMGSNGQAGTNGQGRNGIPALGAILVR